MARTGGEITRAKILRVAEGLFADKGFNATSVEMIAKTARVNKALIYYHFKDKKDIVDSLLINILDAVSEHVEQAVGADASPGRKRDIRLELREEIKFMSGKKDILTVLLMESLKSRNRDQTLFRCAETAIADEHEEFRQQKMQRGTRKFSAERRRELTREFFTGFIPLVSFIVLQKKWSEYLGCAPEQSLDYFMDAFFSSHMASHERIGKDI